MTAQEYIQNQLQHAATYTLTEADKALLDKQGIEAFVYAKLTSKKFRKWAVDESSEKQAKRAIELNVSQNKPIQFRYPFGGYKLWRLPASPEVDWAELFAIAHCLRYLAPIAAAYKPGVELLFGSDDVIIERMDNIPTADTDAYFASFKTLVAQFGKYLPENFKLDIIRIGDLYEDKNLIEQELAASVERLKKEYATVVPEEKKRKMIASSELNVRFDGAKDLTKLSDEEKRAVIEMGPVYHDACGTLSKRREFNRGEDKILIFTIVVPNAFAIGTTKASITKFWTGVGALRPDDTDFDAIILSPSQLEKAKSTWQDVHIDGLDGKNFSKVRILNT